MLCGGCARCDDDRVVPLAEDAQRAMAAFDRESSTLVAHASLTRRPFNPRSTAGAARGRGGTARRRTGRRPDRSGRVVARSTGAPAADGLTARGSSDSSIDVGEAIEAAHRRQPTVDRRRCQFPVFHPASYNSMWGRVAARTARLLSEAHWKKPRRSSRYASNVRPLERPRKATAASYASSMTKSSLGVSMAVVVALIVVMAVPPFDGRTSQLRPLSRRCGCMVSPASPCSFCRPKPVSCPGAC